MNNFGMLSFRKLLYVGERADINLEKQWIFSIKITGSILPT